MNWLCQIEAHIVLHDNKVFKNTQQRTKDLFSISKGKVADSN